MYKLIVEYNIYTFKFRKINYIKSISILFHISQAQTLLIYFSKLN